MYFWRIETLKDLLRAGPLPQRYAFAYVFIAFFLLELFVGLPALWNTDPLPVTVWSWVAYVLTLTLFAAGTYAAYRANGGNDGLDFAARYLALGWVLTIRLLVLVFVPLLLVAFIAVMVWLIAQSDVAAADTLSDDWGPEWIGEAVTVVFLAIFYWRLARHFRDIARPASLPGEHASPAA